mmetsp:Transcript_10346/g.32194  ORF Transcript_10346/g.32194 Transcript_10346/m.32194 type:complete len:209 (-) Transcript_10346:135-761(-)
MPVQSQLWCCPSPQWRQAARPPAWCPPRGPRRARRRSAAVATNSAATAARPRSAAAGGPAHSATSGACTPPPPGLRGARRAPRCRPRGPRSPSTRPPPLPRSKSPPRSRPRTPRPRTWPRRSPPGAPPRLQARHLRREKRSHPRRTNLQQRALGPAKAKPRLASALAPRPRCSPWKSLPGSLAAKQGLPPQAQLEPQRFAARARTPAA